MLFVDPGSKTRDTIALEKFFVKIANEPGNVQTRATIQKEPGLFVARLTEANQLHLRRSPSLLAFRNTGKRDVANTRSIVGNRAFSAK
jgi:hypothetical protein